MRKSLWILVYFLVVSYATGQDISLLHSIRQDSAIDLYLRVDWKHIEKTKKDKVYMPCEVHLSSNSRDSISIEANVKTRGHMRLEICSFPPLKLKFDKSELAKHDLSPLNEMDIVHRCHDGVLYNQYLLREYLAYKIWEEISPYHFKTQLVHMHYVNPDGSNAHESNYAFLVENSEEVVDRLGGRRYKTPVISRTSLDKKEFLAVALFQFMIGNTDWHIPSRHNLDFVAIPGHTLLVAIPFDFDYSGLVDAPYAAAHESLKLSSVNIRYYQGWCHSGQEVNDALEIFRDKKERILSLPNLIEGLDEKSIKHLTTYISDFYEIIENPKKLENQIIRHCDMWPVED
jgi:hypothetical protein